MGVTRANHFLSQEAKRRRRNFSGRNILRALLVRSKAKLQIFKVNGWDLGEIAIQSYHFFILLTIHEDLLNQKQLPSKDMGDICDPYDSTRAG